MNATPKEALQILSNATQPSIQAQMTREDYFNTHVALQVLGAAVQELEKTRAELQETKAVLAKIQIDAEADGKSLTAALIDAGILGADPEQARG